MAMKIVITGNMGYVGPVLVRHLRRQHPDAWIVGIDIGLFAHCLTAARRFPEVFLNEQRFADVRGLTAADFAGVDAVVHLAAVSNDPIGNRFEAATEAINFRASVDVAAAAAAAGVKNFVYASSCSIYGQAADGRPRREGDAVNPLTAYARSKVAAEESFRQMDRRGMTVTSLRFATACGMSERLRLDLVLNDFVAGALVTGEIKVLSDGTPWRPLIDVEDMARAIDWAISRPAQNGGGCLVVNVGSDGWNFQVEELAKAAARAIASSKVWINKAAPPDKRSYRVDFGLFAQLAPNHQPAATLSQTIDELRRGLIAVGFQDANFRQSQLMRLNVLDRHMTEGRLTPDLRWADGSARA
jgi:nucleoside-diphosphate-sugar epimerase